MKKKPGNKQIHFKTVLLIAFLTVTLAVIMTLMILSAMFIKTFHDQASKSSATLLGFYAQELENNASDLENIVSNIYSNNASFQTLANGSFSNNEKIALDYQLRAHINGSVRYGSIIMAFTPDDNVCIWQVGSGFEKTSFAQNYVLEKKLESYISSLPPSELWKWNLYSDDGDVLLVLAYKKNNLYIASCLDLSKFIDKDREYANSDDYEIAFFNEKEILTNTEPFNKYSISLETIENGNSNFFTNLNYILQSVNIPSMPVRIASIMPISGYIVQYRPFILIMFIVFSLLAILVMAVFDMFKNILLYPLDKISEASKILAEPDNENVLPADDQRFDIYEINEINDALSALVKQKVSLAKESEHRKLEKEHAQLQYFQLQTKSHFFINCLKSLYNMLEMGEYDKMRRMIMDFSDHIRFIFHDNLSLISLKDELEEVHDYANIIQTDSSAPLMLINRVPAELYECMVPPLIIQTFLENSIKYNFQETKSLMRFVIDCELTEDSGKKFIRIKLSDNGSGFAPEVMKQLNYNDDNKYEQYHVGISNLKRRMEILYHNDCSLAFLNDQESNGAVVLLYIPAIF